MWVLRSHPLNHHASMCVWCCMLETPTSSIIIWVSTFIRIIKLAVKTALATFKILGSLGVPVPSIADRADFLFARVADLRWYGHGAFLHVPVIPSRFGLRFFFIAQAFVFAHPPTWKAAFAVCLLFASDTHWEQGQCASSSSRRNFVSGSNRPGFSKQARCQPLKAKTHPAEAT